MALPCHGRATAVKNKGTTVGHKRMGVNEKGPIKDQHDNTSVTTGPEHHEEENNMTAGDNRSITKATY